MCQCIGTPECQCDMCPNSGDMSRGWRLGVFCDSRGILSTLDEKKAHIRKSDCDEVQINGTIKVKLC